MPSKSSGALKKDPTFGFLTFGYALTRLRQLNCTSLLPSSCNWSFSSSTYGKQKISDFPPCGKGKWEGGKFITIFHQFHYDKFWAKESHSFDSSVSRATDDGSKVWCYESCYIIYFAHCEYIQGNFYSF